MKGQAKKYEYIRNAFGIMDPGKAYDVVWRTLEEIYGQKEILVGNAKKLVQRRGWWSRVRGSGTINCWTICCSDSEECIRPRACAFFFLPRSAATISL